MAAKVGFVGLILLGWLLGLAVNFPVTLLAKVASLPVAITHAEGSLWQGRAMQISGPGWQLEQIRWQLHFGQGLPALAVSVGGGSAGQGSGVVGWWGNWRIADGRWQLPASRIPLILPLPGDLVLRIPFGQFTASSCLGLSGSLRWQGGGVLFPQPDARWQPQLQLNCQEGAVIAQLLPTGSPLDVQGQARLNGDGRWQVDGVVTDTAALPAAWQLAIQRGTTAGPNGQRQFSASGRLPMVNR